MNQSVFDLWKCRVTRPHVNEYFIVNMAEVSKGEYVA